MRISEVAALTGLAVSNIRFYEKKGLLAVQREKESKYRDYSEEDIERLKIILLYRKMNFSIDTYDLFAAAGKSRFVRSSYKTGGRAGRTDGYASGFH